MLATLQAWPLFYIVIGMAIGVIVGATYFVRWDLHTARFYCDLSNNILSWGINGDKIKNHYMAYSIEVICNIALLNRFRKTRYRILYTNGKFIVKEAGVLPQ